MSRKAFWLSVLFYTWLVMILAVSSIPDIGSNEETLLGFDKYAHFGEYFVLAVLYLIMKRARRGEVAIKNYLFLAIPLPFLEELHQIWIRGRLFSLLDFAADWAGVTLVFLVYYLIKSRKQIKL